MRKRNKVIVAAVVLLLAVGLYNSAKEEPLAYTSAKVERGDVVQTVSATGAVEAAKKIDLKFVNPERIKEVNVRVGDVVGEGDVLAKLDTSKLDSQLLQSQAALVAAEANLRTIIQGSSNEQVRVAETVVENAEIALAAARQNLQDTNVGTVKEIASAESSVQNAKVSLDSANRSLDNTRISNENNLNNAYEAAWDGINSALAACDEGLSANKTVLDNDDAKNTLSVLNYQYLSASNLSKLGAANSYNSAVSFRNSVLAKRTPENIDEAMSKTQDALEKTRITLSDTYLVLQATVISSNLTQSELDSLKSTISGQRSGLNSAISALTTKKQGIANQKVANQTSLTSAQSAVNSASSALNVTESNLSAVKSAASAKINSAQNAIYSREGDLRQAQENLNQVKAGPLSSQIAAARAQVDQAKASVEMIRSQIDDASLVAPHSGIITALKGEIGEIASMNEPFVSIIIPNGFQITANVSEVEIAKLKIGDKVDITFDALGSDERFTGEISEIDPAETQISGVVYYKVTTLFMADSQIIKPGMTANLDILTAKKENVLNIPFQALKEKDGKKYVQVVVKNEVREIPVKIGLKGDASYEIIEGIEEGGDVVTFLGNKK